MSQPKRIFIIGHSGAGKGVLAKGVAEKLGWKFIDADFSLVPSIGRTINDIIGKQGEAVFQNCLSDILAHQVTQEHIVVTTDDSIVLSEESRTILSSEFTVYLKVSTEVQLERISHNRPLLPVSDYKAFLNKLHVERNALFEKCAKFTVDSDDNDLESHIHQVVEAVKSRCRYHN